MEEHSTTQTAVACTACQAAQPCPEHRGTSPVGGNPTAELSAIPQADSALLLSTTDATPFERKYRALKSDHTDTLLLFRVGDFYEAYEDDARTLAADLGVALTTKRLGPGRRLPMAGVPAQQLEQSIARLLAKGRKTGVVEQILEESAPLPAVQVATSSPTPQTGDSGIAVRVDAAEAERPPSVEPRDAPNEPVPQEPVAPAVTMPEPGAAKLAGGAGSWRRSDIKLVIHLTPHGNRFEAILSAGGTSGMIPIPAPRLKRLGRVSVTEAITELGPFWEECQLVWDEKPTYSYYRPATQPSATPAARTQRRARAKDVFETMPPAQEDAGAGGAETARAGAVAPAAAPCDAESTQGQLGLF